MRTGSIQAGGKIKARKINVGLELVGEVSDDVLKAALSTMERLNTGDVIAE